VGARAEVAWAFYPSFVEPDCGGGFFTTHVGRDCVKWWLPDGTVGVLAGACHLVQPATAPSPPGDGALAVNNPGGPVRLNKPAALAANGSAGVSMSEADFDKGIAAELQPGRFVRVVGGETAIANAEAEKVGAVKKECEDDLAVAMPILNAALAALDTITAKDIGEIKAFPKPPPNVRMVMGGICAMLGEKPEKVADPAGGTKKIDDYW
jgi:hypothetical protein